MVEFIYLRKQKLKFKTGGIYKMFNIPNLLKNKKKGFEIVQVIVILAVVAIIAVTVIPNLQTQIVNQGTSATNRITGLSEITSSDD